MSKEALSRYCSPFGAAHHIDNVNLRQDFAFRFLSRGNALVQQFSPFASQIQSMRGCSCLYLIGPASTESFVKLHEVKRNRLVTLHKCVLRYVKGSF